MELYNRSINYLSQTIDMIDYCIDRPITSNSYYKTASKIDKNFVALYAVISFMPFPFSMSWMDETETMRGGLGG